MPKIITNKEIVERAKSVHGDRYEYNENFEYKGIDEKMPIYCKIHGLFYQSPYNHIKNKQGCPYCNHRSYKYSTEEFINKAKEIHNDKYDYSKVEYKGNKTKVTIICPIHGEFQQLPSDHINKKCGCPYCKSSKLEDNLEKILKEENISYIKGYKENFLKRQHIDFFLKDYNIGIECQGEQHFKPIDFGGKGNDWAINHFNKTKELDIQKYNLCKENNIKIIYFANKKYNDNIITNKEELLKEIKQL